MKHLLDIDDLSSAEILEILKLSDGFAGGAHRDSWGEVLAGSGVALLFEKASLRTRNSMEMAVVHLGGHPVSITASEVGLGSRESASDIAKTLSGYHSFIGARVFLHNTLVELAEVSSVPVLNLLSDVGHPLQALADLLTVQQTFGNLDGIKLAYIGDANNVAHSLALAAERTGMSFAIASPKGYGFLEPVFGEAFLDPNEAVEGADVVYTDVWTSMGQEGESAKREKAFKNFCVTQEMMSLAKPNAIFLHCLPAHRGQEVAANVIDSDATDGGQSRVWQQAQNRMYSAMGAIAYLQQTT